MAHVMLVDDDERILRTVEMALKALGHEVTTASSPDKALEALPYCCPDAMVVDVMMPSGTEGFHLVWKVRQLEDEKLRDTPIIMATGIHSETELRFYPDKSDGTYTPGEFLPIQAWIDKPVRLEELRAKLDEVLAGR